VTVAREHITEVRDRQCSKGFSGPQRRGGGLSLSSEQWLELSGMRRRPRHGKRRVP
jgi:hypothetical protein